MDGTPPERAGEQPKEGSCRGCLAKIGVGFLALIGGCFFFESRRPHFNVAPPVAINVRVGGYADEKYKTAITNRAACAALLREFGRAHPIFGSTKVVGEFTIHYSDGTTEIVPFLPGLSHGQYSIIVRRPFPRSSGTFWIPSERFYQLLKDGGVDVSQIPQD